MRPGFARHPRSSLVAHSACEFDRAPDWGAAQLARELVREEGERLPVPDDEVVYCVWPREVKRPAGWYDAWIAERQQADLRMVTTVYHVEGVTPLTVADPVYTGHLYQWMADLVATVKKPDEVS